LRKRIEDIPFLAKYFVRKYSHSLQRRVRGISPEAMECLQLHDWPGNVRELENLIERAVVLGSSDMILLEDLPEELAERSPQVKTGFLSSVREAKRNLVMRAIREAGGNYTEAAKSLGIHPNYLYRLLRTLGLKKENKS
jgi:DNA-binding NtrC family response regulator